MARHAGGSSLRTRRNRRQGGVKFRIYTPKWQDPYPWIPGTEPEKRTFAALVRHGFYFWFQPERLIPEDYTTAALEQGTLLTKHDYVPDFVLPEYKVIFDPFGDYHHSLPQQREADGWKMAYYESMGYEFVHDWASIINRNGGEWFLGRSKRIWQAPKYKLSPLDQARKASVGYFLGPNLGLGSKSVAISNKKRAVRKTLGLGTSR